MFNLESTTVNTRILFALITMLSLTLSANAAAQGQWTAGIVGIATQDQGWSTDALPWLSYRGEHFTVNPMKAALIGQKGALHWEAGLGLDYNELFDETDRGFLAQLDSQYFWGPIRFSTGVSSRWVDPLKAWQGSAMAGSQFPLGKGLFGAEVGLHNESVDWDNSKQRTEAALSGVAAVQYGLEFGGWQSMLIAQFQSESLSGFDAAKQTYTLLLMRSW